MSEQPKRWRSLLGNVPVTSPHDEDGNVHPLPISLDKIEHEIKQATNMLVHLEAEADKIEQAYHAASETLRAAQMRFVDRAKHLGMRVEIVERKGE
jgi:predicted  nucleic acid-binding Zn-ribbon protein